ncbi:MAG: biopolymer transporter ExbD [Candidatus Fermentibacteraceae bacterium]
MSAPSKRHVPLLLGYNKTKAFSRKGDKKAGLNLTSMIDMFTILVVFLLKSYSAEGQLVTVSEALTLPRATSEQRIEMKLEIEINREAVVVDGDPVVQVDQQLLSTGGPIPSLVTRLDDHMEYTRQMKGTITEDEQKINIQGDVAIPAVLVQRVMASCSEAGFSLQNLEVIKEEGGRP